MKFMMNLKTVAHTATNAGMGTASMAYRRAGVPHKHAFASESNANCRRMIGVVDQPEILHLDALVRDNSKLPSITDYWGTPPCKPSIPETSISVVYRRSGCVGHRSRNFWMLVGFPWRD